MMTLLYGTLLFTFARKSETSFYLIYSGGCLVCTNHISPGSDIPQASFLDEIYFDKWVHIGLFSGLTFLTAWPFVAKNLASRKLLIKIGTTFIIYGVLMDFVQKYLAIA